MPLVSSEKLFTEQGVQRTRSLFRELHSSSEEEPVFTLGREEKEGYHNIRTIFIELTVDDPTELTFAEYCFGDYKYWERIATSTWIQDYLVEWRNVADIKRKQQAFQAIIEEAKNGKAKFSAAKYLIDEPWKGSTAKTRPASVKKTTELAYDSIKSDVDRLRSEGLIN